MERPAAPAAARHGHSGGKGIIRAAYSAWPGAYPGLAGARDEGSKSWDHTRHSHPETTEHQAAT